MLSFARLCPLCQGHTRPRGCAFCPECARSFWVPTLPICDRCGVSLPAIGPSCERCRREPLPFSCLRSLFPYTRPSVRNLILSFKFGGRADLARPIATLMAEEFPRQFGFWPRSELIDGVLSPPSDWLQFARRGYNPARLIANEFGHITGIPNLCRALRKSRRPLLSSLSAAKRRSAIRDAFSLVSPLRDRTRILLIDDVVTSQATVEEIARTVRFHSPRMEILAYTFARA